MACYVESNARRARIRDQAIAHHCVAIRSILARNHRDELIEHRYERLPVIRDPKTRVWMVQEGPLSANMLWTVAKQLSLKLATLERGKMEPLLLHHLPIQPIVTLTMSYLHACIVIEDGCQ